MYMNAKEALQQIINNTPKGSIWYKVSSDYDEVNRLRAIANRINEDANKMQVSTLIWFFSKFGYEVDIKMSVKPKAK